MLSNVWDFEAHLKSFFFYVFCLFRSWLAKANNDTNYSHSILGLPFRSNLRFFISPFFHPTTTPNLQGIITKQDFEARKKEVLGLMKESELKDFENTLVSMRLRDKQEGKQKKKQILVVSKQSKAAFQFHFWFLWSKSNSISKRSISQNCQFCKSSTTPGITLSWRNISHWTRNKPMNKCWE